MKRKILFIDLWLILTVFILLILISFYGNFLGDFLGDLFWDVLRNNRKFVYILLFALVVLQLVLAIFWKKARKWWIFLIYFVLGAITAVFGYVLDYTVYGEVPSDLDIQNAYFQKNNQHGK